MWTNVQSHLMNSKPNWILHPIGNFLKPICIKLGLFPILLILPSVVMIFIGKLTPVKTLLCQRQTNNTNKGKKRRSEQMDIWSMESPPAWRWNPFLCQFVFPFNNGSFILLDLRVAFFLTQLTLCSLLTNVVHFVINIV